jgi:hypothetical protein
LRAYWDDGAYLEAGRPWLCLSRDPAAETARTDYTHCAFNVAEEDFAELSATVRGQAVIWKDNRSNGPSL